jgi:hypothetical protein
MESDSPVCFSWYGLSVHQREGTTVANFNAFCIRGWLSVLVSRAMENLSVPWLTQQCIGFHKVAKKIVLIGHSFGGTAAIMTTQNLNAVGI